MTYLAAIGAFIVGLLAIFGIGRKAGKDAVKAEANAKGVEDAKQAVQVEQEVAATPVSDVRRKLRDHWSRH